MNESINLPLLAVCEFLMLFPESFPQPEKNNKQHMYSTVVLNNIIGKKDRESFIRLENNKHSLTRNAKTNYLYICTCIHHEYYDSASLIKLSLDKSNVMGLNSAVFKTKIKVILVSLVLSQKPVLLQFSLTHSVDVVYWKKKKKNLVLLLGLHYHFVVWILLLLRKSLWLYSSFSSSSCPLMQKCRSHKNDNNLKDQITLYQTIAYKKQCMNY